jgi:hypothetical protein
MIKQIIDLLQTNTFYGQSKAIDIAKGKHAIPYTWSDLGKNIKRRLWQTRKSK